MYKQIAEYKEQEHWSRNCAKCGTWHKRSMRTERGGIRMLNASEANMRAREISKRSQERLEDNQILRSESFRKWAIRSFS